MLRNPPDRAEQMQPSLRSALAHPAVAAGLGFAIFLIAIAGVITGLTDVDGTSFWESAVTTLMTVAGGVVITGVVGVGVSRLRDRDVEVKANAQFIEDQVVKLWDVHEQVKRAAVLIASHQSAKTYGEQLRTIIELRTRLSDIQGVVERRRADLPGLDFGAFLYQLDTALFFLNPLVDEFRLNYTEISAKQRVDEAANQASSKTGEWSGLSTLAWSALRDRTTFGQLHKLLAFGELTADDYRHDSDAWATADLTVEFLDPIDLAAQLLRARTRRARRAIEPRIEASETRRRHARVAVGEPAEATEPTSTDRQGR